MTHPSKRKVTSPNRPDHHVVSGARDIYSGINNAFPAIEEKDILVIEKHGRMQLTVDLRSKLSQAVGLYRHCRSLDERTPLRGGTSKCLAKLKNSADNLKDFFPCGERESIEMNAVRGRIIDEFFKMDEKENLEATTDKLVEAYRKRGILQSREHIRKGPFFSTNPLMDGLFLFGVAVEQAQEVFDQERKTNSGGDVALNNLHGDLDKIYKKARGRKGAYGDFLLQVFTLIPLNIRPPTPVIYDNLHRRTARARKK